MNDADKRMKTSEFHDGLFAIFSLFFYFFSEYGALQLLTDFAYVSTWVKACSIISQNVRNHLLKNEMLRRCEGVGRLLLRHPGEAIPMQKRLGKCILSLW